MNMKRIAIISLIVILLGIVIYYYYKDYRLGSREEREEILTATLFDLSENREMKQGEIEEIFIIRSYAGIYPFFYQVRVQLKNGQNIKYRWTDKEKTAVESLIY